MAAERGFAMSVRLDPDLHARVEAEAKRDERTVASLVRLAVREYLSAKESGRALSSGDGE